MKKLLPIIAALSVVAVYATAQTTYLGNILQMHRQVEPLPDPTAYEGSVVYNRDAGALYFSNGTIWAPIAGDGGSGSSSGGNQWIDAGALLAGAIQPNGVGLVAISQGRESFVNWPSNNIQANSTLWAYIDGGTTAYLAQGQVILNPTYAQATDSNTIRPVLALDTDNRTNPNSAVTKLSFRNASAGEETGAIIGAGGLGSQAPLVSGLNFWTQASATPRKIGFTTNARSTATLVMDQNGGLVTPSATTDLVVATYRMTLRPVDTFTAGLAFAEFGATANAFNFQTNGNRGDFGTGTNDYLASDGTRVQVGGGSGGFDVANLRVVGNAGASTTVTSATSGNGGIGFNQASGTHYMMATNKEARPILSGADWVYDGRSFELEVTHELTACPVLRRSMSRLGSSGGGVTVFCNDSASATVTVGAGHPAQPYRNFVTTAVSGQRSIVGGFATSAPASGASATPQTFISRQAGPMFGFRLRTGSAGWTSNITWYAGMFSTIPTSGSPYGSSVYLRFDTNNPLPSSTADTRFRLCACNSGTCTCSDLSVAPAASTEYLFEVDCRETSSACYVYMNGLYETSVSTNLPGTSTPMGFAFAVENVDATARTAGLGRLRIRQE